MFFQRLFKKQGTQAPSHSFLDAYARKAMYFVRIKRWDWLNEKQIYVADKIDGKPKMITMEFWAQEIYLDANGQITVEELILTACQQYKKSKMEIPPNIDKVLIDCLESLVFEEKIIAFKEKKTALPKNIELAISKHT
jgi:hypothetical protein